jgi:ribulose bisphosphate carboxylase small subunit
MKIPIPCPQCLAETNNAKSAATAVLRDDCTYAVCCANGHRTVSILSNPKFEVLYINGVNAIDSGYMREAVSSFAACIERYYEFFLRVIFLVDKKDTKVFNKVWKRVSAQSERQLGAYIFSYFRQYDSEPELLSNDLVELRNKVIHKGYIPTEEEAKKFQKATLQIVGQGIEQLQNKYLKEVVQVIQNQYKNTDYDTMVTAVSELKVINPAIIKTLK